MKIPEHIRVNLALRRAARCEWDPYSTQLVGMLLAVGFGVAIICLMIFAIFAKLLPHINCGLTVM